MNPLTYLSPRMRLTVYLALLAAGAVLTAISAGFAAIAETAPRWVTFGLAAVGSLSTVGSATAAANVYKTPAAIEGGDVVLGQVVDPAAAAAADNAGEPPQDEDPVVDVDEPLEAQAG